MALIPATINVNFQAQYIGVHRVCYRIGGSGDYTCINTTCTIVGACSASLDIFVDNETCTAVVYNGYIQPACVPSDSTDKRVPFTVTFTPSPSCQSYVATCTRLGISHVTVTDGGSGYSVGSPPPVNIIGGNGAATATSTVGAGALSAGTVVSPGSGYVNGTFTNVSVMGGGFGAAATVVISSNQIISITITAAGMGYTSGTGLTLDNTNIAPSGPEVTATVSFVCNFQKVISITVTNITPFTSTPIIVIPGNATAVAVMADCPIINNPGCTGSDIDIAAGTIAGFGGTVTLCGYSIPAVNPAYEITPSGNCVCGCVTAQITIAGAAGNTIRYYYNKCKEEPRTGILTVGGSPSSVVDCIVPGSLVFQIIDEGASGVVHYGSSCTT